MRARNLVMGIALLAPAGTAMALPTFPDGAYTFDLEDRSSLFSGTTPLGPGAIQSNGAGGFFVNTGGLTAPVNQKSIYVLKEVANGTVRAVGANGMKDIVFSSATGQSFIPGGSGISYDLNLTASGVKSTGGLAPQAVLNFEPGSIGFTDLVASTAGAQGLGGLTAGGLATKAAGFGGIVDFYFNPANNAVFGLNSDGDFVVGGGIDGLSLAPGDALGFPNFAEDGAGWTLFARGVFTPLLAPDNQHPTQSALIDPTTVLYEQIDVGAGTGFGFGFINIIEADASYINSFTPDFFGPGRDLRIDFQISFERDGSGNAIDTDGFNVVSTDPVQAFQTGAVPEPVTTAGMAMGLLALAGLATRRRAHA